MTFGRADRTRLAAAAMTVEDLEDDPLDKVRQSIDAARYKTERAARKAAATVVASGQYVQNAGYKGTHSALFTLGHNLMWIGLACTLGIGGGLYVRHQNVLHDAAVQAQEHEATMHNGDAIFGRPISAATALRHKHHARHTASQSKLHHHLHTAHA